MVEEMSEAEAREFVVRAGDIPAGRREAPPVEITALRWLAGSNASSALHLMAVGWGAGVMLWKDPAIPHGQPVQLKIPRLGTKTRGSSGAAQATDVLSSCCAPKLFVACGTADGRVLAWFFAAGDLRIRSPMPKGLITMPPQEGGNQPCPAEMLFWLGGSRALLGIGSGRMHFLSVYSGEVTAVDVAVLQGLCAAALSDDGQRLVAGTSTGTVVVYDVSNVHSDDSDAKLPELGRCVIHDAPKRITSLAVCGHKERPPPQTKSKRKRQMKPLPGMAKYARPDSAATDEVEIVPEAPDWILVGCEDGSVFACTGNGSECLGLIDEVDMVRLALEKKEEEEKAAAEAAAAVETQRLVAEEERAKKEAKEKKQKGGRRAGRGGR